jgi:DNA polymerase-3 subunit gamma/tau
MVLVRLAYVADMPVPAELVRRLAADQPLPAAPTVSATPAPGAAAPMSRPSAPVPAARSEASAMPAPVAPQPAPAPPPAPLASAAGPLPQDFRAVVALFEERREALIASQLQQYVHLVAFEPGRIEFRPAEGAPRDLASRLGQYLGEWTGTRWVVAVSQGEGLPTLQEADAQIERARKSEVAGHPLVRAALDAFPGATIAAVRERFAAAEPGSDAAEGEAVSDDETGSGEEEE